MVVAVVKDGSGCSDGGGGGGIVNGDGGGGVNFFFYYGGGGCCTDPYYSPILNRPFWLDMTVKMSVTSALWAKPSFNSL